mmetsp:Transcript_39179/g.65055  ORF Transcript_39179/g.65055 Transcript_39179/m.65055 type:complete len:222 (-) Transcript_39179:33-698(-)
MCTRLGRAYARVLPLPVWAMPMQSRPRNKMGHAKDWMGYGLSNFLVTILFTASPKSTSSKVRTGGGQPSGKSTLWLRMNSSSSSCPTSCCLMQSLKSFLKGCAFSCASVHCAGSTRFPSFHRRCHWPFSSLSSSSRFRSICAIFCPGFRFSGSSYPFQRIMSISPSITGGFMAAACMAKEVDLKVTKHQRLVLPASCSTPFWVLEGQNTCSTQSFRLLKCS